MKVFRGVGPGTAVVVAIAIAGVATPATQAATTPSRAVLVEGVGMRAAPSVRVQHLQQLLLRRGYHLGRSGVDGRFGPRTKAAVRRAQRAHHLEVDGIVGRATRRALRATAASRRTSHDATASLRPVVMTTTAAAPRAASSPESVRLSAPKQDSPASIVGLAAFLGLVLIGVAFAMQRRRYDRRLAAYRLSAVPAPTEAPSERREPPAPKLVVPEPALPRRSGLQPGAAVIGCVTGPRVSRPSGRTPERDIQRACERSGWHLVEIVHDDDDGPAILERPVPARALERIAKGEARGLVINDARMLSRSADFAEFVQWFRESDAAFIALDLGLDTSTAEGHRVATALVTLNGWAGQRIASRTRRAALAVPEVDDAAPRLAVRDRGAVLERIATLHGSGLEPQEIADQLNDEGVRTLFGTERWWPSSVETALRYWRARTAPSPIARRAAGGWVAD